MTPSVRPSVRVNTFREKNENASKCGRTGEGGFRSFSCFSCTLDFWARKVSSGSAIPTPFSMVFGVRFPENTHVKWASPVRPHLLEFQVYTKIPKMTSKSVPERYVYKGKFT